MEDAEVKGSAFPIGRGAVYAVAAAAMLLGAAYYFLVPGAQAGAVVSGDVISVYYTGRFANGTVFDSNVGKQPLTFMVGSGQMIPGFDQGVVGMQAGQNKTLVLPANEAYGEVNPALIVQVPVSKFGNQSLSVGMPITETSGSQQFQGTITAISGNSVTVDFNPKMAGKALVFEVELVSIKK